LARTQIPLETTCLSPGSDRSFLLRKLRGAAVHARAGRALANEGEKRF
jgi:hypothetical protein